MFPYFLPRIDDIHAKAVIKSVSNIVFVALVNITKPPTAFAVGGYIRLVMYLKVSFSN